MTFPIARLVDAPAADAAVRYDFNDRGLEGTSDPGPAAPRWVTRDFTLGTPPIEGDPDAVGIAYGWRQPSFGHVIMGTKADALAALAALSRELLRPRGWFMFQLDATTRPVFFRIYRISPEALSWENVYTAVDGDIVEVPDLFEVRASFVADPFGYLERVTLDPIALTQSPTGLAAVLPPIKGDAPAPLRVAIEVGSGLTGAGANTRQAWFAGVTTGPDTAAAVGVDVGTGDGFTTFTSGGPTHTVANDAAYFGGSYRGMVPDTSEDHCNLIGTLPAVPAGRYKILLRGDFNFTVTSTATYIMRLLLGPTQGPAVPVTPIYTSVPTAINGVYRRWVDLGDFTLPVFGEVPDDVDVTISAQPFLLRLWATDTPPADAVRVDALRLIPIDGPGVEARTMVARLDYGTPLAGGDVGYLDGDDDLWWAVDDGSLWQGTAALFGGFPVVDPGAEKNLLHLFAYDRGTPGATPVTDLNAPVTATVSYHPRVLHLPDGT